MYVIYPEFRHLKQKLHSTHEKMGTIKERNGMDLTETEDIKTIGQEYTDELQKRKKKIFKTQVTTMV